MVPVPQNCYMQMLGIRSWCDLGTFLVFFLLLFLPMKYVWFVVVGSEPVLGVVCDDFCCSGLFVCFLFSFFALPVASLRGGHTTGRDVAPYCIHIASGSWIFLIVFASFVWSCY